MSKYVYYVWNGYAFWDGGVTTSNYMHFSEHFKSAYNPTNSITAGRSSASVFQISASSLPRSTNGLFYQCSYFTIFSRGRRFFSSGAGSIGYPRSNRPTTLMASGMPRIFLTWFSLNAPIQQVPNPSAAAQSMIWVMAIDTFIV